MAGLTAGFGEADEFVHFGPELRVTVLGAVRR
jgi:hypothetical protein